MNFHAGVDRKNMELLPPIIAQILVKKCKNGICSSLKVTCNIKHINLQSDQITKFTFSIICRTICIRITMLNLTAPPHNKKVINISLLMY